MAVDKTEFSARLQMMSGLRIRACILLCLVVLFTGCAGERAYRAGENLMASGDYDGAVSEFERAVKADPKTHEYQVRLIDAQHQAAWKHLEQARILMSKGKYAEAQEDLRLAKNLNPSLAVAAAELATAIDQVKISELLGEAESLVRERRFPQAQARVDQALQLDSKNEKALDLMAKIKGARYSVVDGMELDVTSSQPISLKFKDAKIRDVFAILSKLSGIHFIFDEEIKTQNVSIALEEATFAQALELLLKMNNLGTRVLNPKTLIVYTRSKEKDKQYEDQIIQTFYLSNIDAKKAVNLLRTMLQLKKVYVHEELNAIVVRDNPAAVKLSQKILEAADRANSEVVFDLELIEINHDDSLKLGPKVAPYGVAVGMGHPGSVTTTGTGTGTGTTTTGTFIVDSTLTAGGSAGNLISSLKGLTTFYTLPTASFDFAKTLKDSELLANPQIRVNNREKAKVHVGSREPIVTVTLNGEQTTENIQYVDVGIKLDIEPTVQLDGTVVTKVSLEVSSKGAAVAGTKSTVFPITTTNAQTALTLKDGERTVIGGLIREEKGKTKNTLPILGSIPVLGDLVTNHDNSKNKKEILLSITPHIVRSLDMPEADISSIWSGGEDDLKAGPNFGSFAKAFEADTGLLPFSAAPSIGTPAPAVAPTEQPQLPAATAPSKTEGRPVEQPVPAPVPSAQPASPAPVPVAAPAPVPPAGPAVPAAPTAAPAPAPVPVATLAPAQTAVPAPAPALSQVAPTAPVPQPAGAQPPAAPSAPGAQADLYQQLKDSGRAMSVTSSPVASIAGEPKVFIQGPLLVNAGASVTYEVKVDELKTLYSAPLFVTFSPDLLEFVSAEEGDFLNRDGVTTIFTSSPNREKGELIVGFKQGSGAKGTSGGGVLMRITFKAKGKGIAALGLSRVNFRMPDGTRIPVVPSGMNVEIR